jgi:hypothetical protein
VPKGYYQDTKI